MAARNKLGEAIVYIGTNNDALRDGLSRAETSTQQSTAKMAGHLNKLGEHWNGMRDKAVGALKRIEEQAIRTAAAIGRIALGGAIAGGAGAFGILQLGVSAVESENLFDVALGKMAGQARAFSETYSKSMRLNAFETRKNLGTLDVFLKSMGMGEEHAEKWSVGLTKLTNDLSSFYNISRQAAFDKVMSGIAGEVRPMRDLGVDLSENAVKAYALRKGMVDMGNAQMETKIKLMELNQRQLELDKEGSHGGAHNKLGIYSGYDEAIHDLAQKKLNMERAKTINAAADQGNFNFELDDTTKLYARLGLMMERTKTASGDLARTLTSPMNILRGAFDSIKGSLTNIGRRLLDDGTPLADLLKRLATWTDKIARALNAWADSDGPKRLELKIVDMFEKAKKKTLEYWDAAKAKWNEFKTSFLEVFHKIEDFHEKNKKWLDPLLIAGAAIGAVKAVQHFTASKKSSEDLLQQLVDGKSAAIPVYIAKGATGATGTADSSGEAAKSDPLWLRLIKAGNEHVSSVSRGKGLAALLGLGGGAVLMNQLFGGSSAQAAAATGLDPHNTAGSGVPMRSAPSSTPIYDPANSLPAFLGRQFQNLGSNRYISYLSGWARKENADKARFAGAQNMINSQVSGQTLARYRWLVPSSTSKGSDESQADFLNRQQLGMERFENGSMRMSKADLTNAIAEGFQKIARKLSPQGAMSIIELASDHYADSN